MTVADGQTLDANGVITLGDGNDDFSIDSNAFDVSNTGAVSGVTDFTASGTITFGNTIFDDKNAVIYGTETTGALNRATTPTPGLCLVSGASAPVWTTCDGATGIMTYWTENNGVLTPDSSTVDLLIGGQATESAKFAILNVIGSRGTQVASFSGDLVLDKAGSLTTTNYQTLTLGGGDTGDILIDSGSDSITIADNLTLNGTTINASSLTTFNTGAALALSGDLTVTGGDLTIGSSKAFVDITGSLELQNLDSLDNTSETTIETAIDTLDNLGSIGSNTLANLTFNVDTAGNYIFQKEGSVFTCGGTDKLTLDGSGYLTCATDDAGSSGTNLWQQAAGGILSPGNLTQDLTFGGTSTTSARFAFINSGSTSLGAPIASLSAGVAGATYLSADGILNVTNNQNLNIGSQTTGDIIFDKVGLTQPIPLSSTSAGLNTASKSIIDAINETYSEVIGTGSTGVWTVSGLVIHPNNANRDLAIGGSDSTASFFVDGNGDQVIITNDQSNDTFVANDQASDTTPFVIDNDGNVGIKQASPRAALDVAGDASTSGSLVFTGSSASVDVLNGYDLNFATSAGGDTGLTNRLTLTTEGNLIPGTNNTYSIGISGTQFASIYGQSLYQNGNTVCDTSGNCSGVSMGLWSLGTGAISTVYPSVDLLIGSSSTSSAKFAITGIAGTNTPVASLSATSGTDVGNGIVLTADGSIQSLRNNTLTLGGDSTGDIAISGPTSITGNTDITGATSVTGNTDITGTLTSSGVIAANGGITFDAPSDTVGAFTMAGNISGANTYLIENIGNANTDFTSGGGLNLAGTLNANGVVALGSGNDVSINSNDWDITSAGVVSGLTGLSSSGTITFSGFTGANNGGVIYANSSGVLSQTAAGSDTQCLLGGSTPSWGSCASGGGGGAFAISDVNGTTVQQNTTTDLLLGGAATSSARFAFINNIGAGTPTASISANSGNNAIYLTGGGVLSTTNRQTLNLGNNASGNIVIDSGTGSVTLSDLTANRLVVTGTGSVLGTSITSANLAASISNETGGTGVAVFNASPSITSPAITTSITTPSTTFGLVDAIATTINFGRTASNTINMGGSGGTLNLGNNGSYTISTVTDDNLTINPNGTGILNLNNSGTGATNIATTNTGAVNIGNGTGTFTLNSDTFDVSSLGVASGLTGLSSSGTITFSGLNGNNGVIYGAAGTGELAQATTGSPDLCLISDAGGTNVPDWGPCTGTGDGSNWDVSSANGTINPKLSNTLDFLLGGTATISSKFAVLGVATNTPTASISAQNANGYAMYLDPANGTLQTLRNQTLTLGGSTTGNIVLNPGSGSLILSDTDTLAIGGVSGGLSYNAISNSGVKSGANVGADNDLYIEDALEVDGVFYADGGIDTTFSLTGGLLYTNGSGVISQLASTGTSTQCLIGNATGAPSWGSCATGGGGVGAFVIGGTGETVQINTTTDFLIGGTSTPSAKFAVSGCNWN